LRSPRRVRCVLLLAGWLLIAAGLFGTPPAAARAEPAATRLSIIDGSEARFRARELFLGKLLTSEAIGRTSGIGGSIVLLADGSFASDQSGITVDLRTLTSDQALRDDYIKSNTLRVSAYPTVQFVPTSALGLPPVLPASGPLRFQIVGDLTVRDKTRSTVWDVDAELTEDLVTGTANTTVTFDQFGLVKPVIEDIASIEDEFKLELDFRASRETAQ
jgi:polyisoprenoid-binding protein YceI